MTAATTAATTFSLTFAALNYAGCPLYVTLFLAGLAAGAAANILESFQD